MTVFPCWKRARQAIIAAATTVLTATCGGPTTAWAQSGSGGSGPVLAVAASMQFAIEDIAAAFTTYTGEPVRISVGSSGNLARQIRQGAPFEVFLAADESTVEHLAADGATADAGVVYAVGRLVLAVPAGSMQFTPDERMDGLAEALAEGRVRRFAIANAEHAPYGMRALEALAYRGLLEAIRPLLVYGENVSQAAQFVTSGNAQAGLVALSLVLSPTAADRVRYSLVPQEWHEPLRQRMVLLPGASEIAVEYYAYMQEPEAREVLERYGFSVPDPQ